MNQNIFSKGNSKRPGQSDWEVLAHNLPCQLCFVSRHPFSPRCLCFSVLAQSPCCRLLAATCTSRSFLLPCPAQPPKDSPQAEPGCPQAAVTSSDSRALSRGTKLTNAVYAEMPNCFSESASL